MAVALKEVSPVEGIKKTEVEYALCEIIHEYERLDGRLKTRMNHEIWHLFQEEQQEINKVEQEIRELLQYK